MGTTIPDANAQLGDGSSPSTESGAFNTFRLGIWTPPSGPQFFPNVQFPRDQASLDQYWFQQTPNTSPENIDQPTRDLQTSTVVNLFQKIRPGILLTHSNSGQYGWNTGIKAPDLVRAIVAYEPGASAFPSDEVPADIPTQNAQVAAITAPQLYPPEQFQNLTKMPIQVIYGDNIDYTTPSPIFGVELWRVNTQRAAQFVDVVNRRGGHAELVFLPQKGLTGNTHFAFSDMNNIQIANLPFYYLYRNGLDGFCLYNYGGLPEAQGQ